jgi:DNA-directed RNA polymerase subunit RPC12/RpoP
MAKETYKMKITCHNCGTEFTEEFEKGHSSGSHSVECSYCGKTGYIGHGFSARKPY